MCGGTLVLSNMKFNILQLVESIPTVNFVARRSRLTRNDFLSITKSWATITVPQMPIEPLVSCHFLQMCIATTSHVARSKRFLLVRDGLLWTFEQSIYIEINKLNINTRHSKKLRVITTVIGNYCTQNPVQRKVGKQS
jgi:hypothetical protein